jgi:hypothetical protein
MRVTGTACTMSRVITVKVTFHQTQFLDLRAHRPIHHQNTAGGSA